MFQEVEITDLGAIPKDGVMMMKPCLNIEEGEAMGNMSAEVEAEVEGEVDIKALTSWKI